MAVLIFNSASSLSRASVLLHKHSLTNHSKGNNQVKLIDYLEVAMVSMFIIISQTIITPVNYSKLKVLKIDLIVNECLKPYGINILWLKILSYLQEGVWPVTKNSCLCNSASVAT